MPITIDPRHPALEVVIAFVVLVLKEAQALLSIYVGSQDQPDDRDPRRPWLEMLGYISSRTWRDSPNSNKRPFSPMPLGKALVFVSPSEVAGTSADTLKGPPPLPHSLPLLLVLSLLTACAAQTLLTKARFVAAQDVRAQAALQNDLDDFSSTTETQIVAQSTPDVAVKRLADFRPGIDFCRKLLDKSQANVGDVAHALGGPDGAVSPDGGVQ